MQVIESTNIDILSPFPIQEAKRVFGWLHAYKSVIETDLSPKSPSEFEEFFTGLIPNLRSYAVIDKFNSLKMNHEAPLIGMIAFEPTTIWNGMLHVASTRRAWGSGLFEEGVRMAISDLFNTHEGLMRVSAQVLANNHPARSLAKRLGFKLEGSFEDWVAQKGEPKAVVQFGMTRKRWVQ
jgi:RimJ/RimL family protein N-acetyltransferase